MEKFDEDGDGKLDYQVFELVLFNEIFRAVVKNTTDVLRSG